MNYRAWQVKDPDEGKAAALASAVGVTKLLARILVERGVDTAPKAIALLGEDAPLSDPFLLKDMDKAVQRIVQAIDNGEPIVVFGDYDVDGVTATAILYEHLRNMGAEVRCKLPSREDDGYGLSRAVLDGLAKKNYTLVVTVDNGISAVDEAAYAKSLGIDLVITDHHLPPEVLPDAVAVVNPQRADDESPFKGLSGAGVAFKLCAALDGCDAEELLDFCGDLAAIGTVADVMPLVGENRTLVKAGLAQLQNSDRPGIVALCEAAGLSDREITAESISFALAPRLNAAGRMDNAALALKLLLCEDYDAACDITAQLDQINQARQAAEQMIMEQVNAQLAEYPDRTRDRVILVWGNNYHAGVIGIVASRLAETYSRPTIVISIQNGEGKGSGRSIAGFNLHAAIGACEDILIRYGGHAQAAGLTVKEENIELLRHRINEWAAQEYPVLKMPPLALDVSVALEQLTVDEVAVLSLLAPCGNGNPAPMFLLRNATIEGIYPVSGGRHSRLRLRQGDASLYAAYFGISPHQLPYAQGDKIDAALTLAVYEGKSGAMLSGRIKEIRPAGLGNEAADLASLFEAFRAGVPLQAEQRKLLAPQRDDTVALYKLIREGKVRGGDLQPLFARMGVKNTGKTLTSLAALEQLELVGVQEREGALFYAALPVAEKKDLALAPILHSLQ